MAYILKKIGKASNVPYHYFECDNETDLSAIKVINIPMGSRCYVINSGKIYALNSLKEWKIVPMSSSDGIGGAYSWNDLTDKPFGETMSSGDTFKWDPETDYANITVKVPITDTYRFCKVSDVVPSFDDVAGGYTYEDGDGVGMGGVVSDDRGYINCGKFVIACEENCSLPYYDYGVITLPETGIYIPVGEDLSYATHTITIPGFTGFPPVPVFKRMDEEYMPLMTSEDGQVWKLAVTPDGEVIAEYVSG